MSTSLKSIIVYYTEIAIYSKTCLKRPLKNAPKIGFKYRFSLNAGQKYCRMLQGEHSAIINTFIVLPFSIKTYFCVFLSGHLRQVLCNNFNQTCLNHTYASIQWDLSSIFLSDPCFLCMSREGCGMTVQLDSLVCTCNGAEPGVWK